MAKLRQDQIERIVARFVDRAGELICADPVCCGRVANETLQLLGEEVDGIIRTVQRACNR
jgi:hypothetical protein